MRTLTVTKLVKVVTCREELPPINSQPFQWGGLVRTRDKLNSLDLHLQKTHEHHTRQSAALLGQAFTITITWPNTSSPTLITYFHLQTYINLKINKTKILWNPQNIPPAKFFILTLAICASVVQFCTQSSHTYIYIPLNAELVQKTNKHRRFEYQLTCPTPHCSDLLTLALHQIGSVEDWPVPRLH